MPADEAHKLGSGRSPTPSPPTTAALEKPNFKGKRTLSGIHDDKVVSFLLFLLLSYTKFDTGPPSLKGVISWCIDREYTLTVMRESESGNSNTLPLHLRKNKRENE